MDVKDELIKSKSTQSFNKMANKYNRSLYGKYSQKVYKYVLDRIDLSQGQTILDVGCGTGELLSQIIEKTKAKIYGIDISLEMVKVAKDKLGESTDIRVGDSEKLPWIDNTFDAIVSTLSFHHYPNPEAVLKELRRVLKQSGKIVIVDVWLPSPLRQVSNCLLPFSNEGDVRIYSREEINNLFSKSELNVTEWTKGFFSQIIVAQKL